MASGGILTMIAMAALAVGFAALASRRGTADAFMRLCWVPLAALVLTLVQQRQLGLTIMIALFVVALATLVLTGLGVGLAVGARRRGAPASALVLGTLVASMPLLFLAARWVVDSMRMR